MKNISLLLLIAIVSCTTTPSKIEVGKDACAYCKMTVSDNRFGAVLLTKKGKSYKFDDESCLRSFLNDNPTMNQKNKQQIFLTNFVADHQLIELSQAILVNSVSHKGPMLGTIIAFSNQDSSKHYISIHGGMITTWKNLIP